MDALTGLDIKKIREDFPVLNTTLYNKPLVYFDNGATTQKPQVVIDRVSALYEQKNATVHRGVHTLSSRMTGEYEQARETVRAFINAGNTNEIIFTSGATGSLNLMAFSFGEKYFGEGDEIIISEMEHHSNIVPWQMMCERKKAKLRVVPFDENGELVMNEYKRMFTDRTRLVAMVHVSNSLGTVNPVKEIISIAHENGVPVLLDGAQAIQHGKVDVRDLDVDYYAFSGHKIYGPNGIGVLYGKEKLLEELPPYQGGGDMVDCVTFEKTTYNVLPFKFEAGTTNYIGAIGMAEAIRYVQNTGLDLIAAHEKDLLEYASKKLGAIPGLTIYGNAPQKISVLSFLLDGIHPYDVGMILDKMGIAVRTGTHCTQPVMDHFNISGTIRASMVFYNTEAEIDILADALEKASSMLR
ncbi:MAG TPA: cysteine desulfurase [Bacteroidales bacterium]|nr:cysteine desulfurase [Bacteroidales bacterium]